MGNSSPSRCQTVVEMPVFAPETIGRLFTNLDIHSTDRLNSRFVVAKMGDLSLIRSTHLSRNCVTRRLQRHMQEAEKPFVFACMPLKGQLRIGHLGRDCTLERGAMSFVMTNEEYVIEMSDSLDALWLRIPTPLLASHAARMQDMLGRPFDVSRGIGYAASEMMLVSLRTSRELDERGSRLLGQSLLGFVGELANSTLPADGSCSTAYRRKILGRALEFVDANLVDEDLNPERIARGVGVSRRYLSQIFAAEGLSVMRWVQQRRLERCRMEMERGGPGGASIREIAYGLGFANISSFNRAFKAHFGSSPRSLLAGREGANEIH